MDQVLTAGIIPGLEYAFDDDNPIKIMARAVLAGRTEPFSKEEVSAIVDQRHFSFEPLVTITTAEEEILKADMVEDTMYRLNQGASREFFQLKCYLIPDINEPGGVHLYSASAIKNKHWLRQRSKGVSRPMTFEEKVIFLSNPQNLKARWAHGNVTQSIASMGYCSIREYNMFGSDAEFTKIIRRIQKDIGRNQLHVLDLGGGIGTALHEAKILHPELVTYNVTRDEEYSCYDVDFQIICFLERMPLGLQGKIDFIFSNMATRYIAFCDLTVQGCIEALAVGGEMDVFFATEKSHNPDLEDVKRRMRKSYEYLKDLESSKLIQLSISSNFTSNIGGSFEAEKDSLYPASRVRVVKL